MAIFRAFSSAESESPVKHTLAGELPDSSAFGQAERRLEADLPLLSDPVFLRKIAISVAAIGSGLGLGVFLFSRFRQARQF